MEEPKSTAKRRTKTSVPVQEDTLIQWVGIFFTQFSTVIFNLLAGLMFLITIAGWMFGISAGAETLQLLAVAFVVFIIPHIAEWLIIRIAVINYGLRDFIKS